jgi:hypothetical protein
MSTALKANRLQGDHVLLRADSLRLLVPREDVGAADHLESAGHSEGLLLALSERMTPLPSPPPGRFVVTAFASRPGVQLLWDEVRMLIDPALAVEELPVAMRAPDSPLTRYVQLDGEPIFCCNAEQLLGHALAGRH